MYPIELAITPDPASGETLRGIGTVEILAKTAPSIQPLSTVNGAPPPPFPNSLYQTLVPGEMPLSWGFYIWGRDGVPQVGADLVKQHDTLYWIVNGKGYRVGWVKVRPPRGAKTFELTTTGPAASADTVVTALPAALLKAQFTPDAYATGRYQVIWHMSGGTTQWMHLNVTSKTKMTVVSAVESAVVTGLDTPAHEDDVLVFQTTIHAGEGGPEIGRSGGRCDGTGAFPGVSPSHVCFTVTALAGGDIWHASWIPNPGEPVQAGAIIGGTGRYAHASGTVTFKDISKAGAFSLAENTYDVRHGARRSEQDAVKFTVVGVVESFEFTGPETPRDEDDVLIFENTLHDGEGGPQVGRTAGRCDATGPLEGGRPADNCFSVSSFAEGDVWYAGWIPAPGDPAPPLPPAAIIGGTGKYAHASGTVTTTDLSKAGDFSTAESVFDIQLNTPKKKHGTRISAVALVESADFTGVDTPRSEDDVLIFESTIHDGAEGPQIGRLAGRCNATGPFPPGRPSDVCFSVHSLDGGDIWSTTWVPAPEGPTPDSAIIGGTGKYANASGTITTKDISEAGDFTVAQLDYNIQP